jgi:hypothetical protein
MYEKQLLNRKIRYFRYAPPMTRLDDTTDDDRPKAPFAGAPLYMCSVYYYWWAFLRLNSDYMQTCEAGGTGQCAELYGDFGDVRSDNFLQWWIDTGRDLFAEPADDVITVVTDADQLNSDKNRVVLSIPVTGDMDRTLAELRKLLQPIYQNHRTNQTRKSQAKYQPHTKPVLSSLHKQLMLWKARQSNPKATLPELAQIAKSGALTEERNKEDKYDHATGSSVSRTLALAEKIIANVGLGRFPDNGRSDMQNLADLRRSNK